MTKLPIFSIPDKPLLSSTQDFVPISDIVDDMVLFKDGGAAIVMESTALNFGLLSEKEQEAVIAAYAALLNSLSFSLQIVIRSQRKDISNYLAYLEEAYTKITNPKLSELMRGYKAFVAETVKKKNVLGKTFYVVVPFSALELGVAKSFLSLTKRAGPLPFPKSYVLKKSKITLYPRRDHIIRQAGRLGLRMRQLSTEELINLYYSIYNPIVQTPKAGKMQGEPK